MKFMQSQNFLECHIYEIANYNNQSSISQNEMEIWYKREAFLSVVNTMQPKTTKGAPVHDATTNGAEVYDVTTQNPCPVGFTLFSTGCFHVSADGTYLRDDAIDYCNEMPQAPGSSLAVFGSFSVSMTAYCEICH